MSEVTNRNFIDINELAIQFGVSTKSIRRRLDELPHLRLGNKILFSTIEIQKLFEPKESTRPKRFKASHPKLDF